MSDVPRYTYPILANCGQIYIHECPVCFAIHEDRCSWDEYCPQHTDRPVKGWGRE